MKKFIKDELLNIKYLYYMDNIKWNILILLYLGLISSSIGLYFTEGMYLGFIASGLLLVVVILIERFSYKGKIKNIRNTLKSISNSPFFNEVYLKNKEIWIKYLLGNTYQHGLSNYELLLLVIAERLDNLLVENEIKLHLRTPSLNYLDETHGYIKDLISKGILSNYQIEEDRNNWGYYIVTLTKGEDL